MKKNLFLAIESSCDDSSVAIIEKDSLNCVFYKTLSQSEHSQAGGVVPELASRLHTAALPDILSLCVPYFERLCAVGATCEPGLSVSLQSGVACAKALSATLKVPFVKINHLKGHICSLFLESAPLKRFLCLLVSGGHTQIISVDNGTLCIKASTNDDSLGESFDKTSKMLGGPYPGGAWVSAKAAWYEQELANGALNTLSELEKAEFFNYSFSVPLMGQKDRAEYSFSGLKNQVRLRAQKPTPEHLKELAHGKICYEFERAAIAHIIDKLKPFLAGSQALGVVGGASANARLRAELTKLCDKANMQLLLAPLEFCADNARMIARAGIFALDRGEFAHLDEAVVSPRTSEFERL